MYITPYFTYVTDWQCVSHAVADKLAVQYQQFLDKNFKQYVIICLPGVKHV